MITTTKPIPLFTSQESAPTMGSLCGLTALSHCHYVPIYDADTLPLVLGEQEQRWNYDYSAAWKRYCLQVARVGALVALRRAIAEDEISRPLNLLDLWVSAPLHNNIWHRPAPLTHQCTVLPMIVVEGGGPVEQPMDLRWSKKRRKIRDAAKAYSEQTHADY